LLGSRNINAESQDRCPPVFSWMHRSTVTPNQNWKICSTILDLRGSWPNASSYSTYFLVGRKTISNFMSAPRIAPFGAISKKTNIVVRPVVSELSNRIIHSHCRFFVLSRNGRYLAFQWMSLISPLAYHSGATAWQGSHYPTAVVLDRILPRFEAFAHCVESESHTLRLFLRGRGDEASPPAPRRGYISLQYFKG